MLAIGAIHLALVVGQLGNSSVADYRPAEPDTDSWMQCL